MLIIPAQNPGSAKIADGEFTTTGHKEYITWPQISMDNISLA